MTGIKIAVRDLKTAIYRLEDFAGEDERRREDGDALLRVADYLRYVMDQRQEFEARREPSDPRMALVKSALKKVLSPRAARQRAARSEG